MTTPPHRTLTKSNAQFQRAVKRLPLGVASTFRYWGDDRTIYVSHGKGGRTWDIDGNPYVDYRLGMAPRYWVMPMTGWMPQPCAACRGGVFSRCRRNAN